MAEIKKADLLIEKIAVLEKQASELDSKIETLLANSEDASMERSSIALNVEDHDESVKEELGYLSAQSESMYVNLAKALSDISEEIAMIKDAIESCECCEPVAPVVAAPEVDSNEIAEKVAEKIAIPTVDVNSDEIAEKVAEKIVMPAQEVISPDYIASQVAAQIVIPELVAPVIDEEKIAQMVADKVVSSINVEDLADMVAKRININPSQFDILVDDDGCDSIAKAVSEKLDYDSIANIVAEKLAPAMVIPESNEIDPEELATSVAEKIVMPADLNEDAIAEKAAAILSNYLPEIDTVDIADKVSTTIIPAIPVPAPVEATATVEEESLNKITESVTENVLNAILPVLKTENDVVIDDEGISKVVEIVKENVVGEYDERMAKMDCDIAEIKALLAAGIVVASESVASEAVACEETVVEEEEEVIPTVEEVVEEVVEEAPVAEPVVETVAEPVPEVVSEESDGEEGEEGEGGVDFGSMMKFNRSYIARIIQSTDDVKNYYGEVKTALLSYKKVNSNIAWGAERFNKGRETIARFKIRGKTLCLYLALDPAEYATSVYHHADVSDNKSLQGTPMFVKIKSARGVKKAIKLVDEMLEKRNGIKQNVMARDYAAMYPYETIEELIEDGLVKDVRK